MNAGRKIKHFKGQYMCYGPLKTMCESIMEAFNKITLEIIKIYTKMMNI